MDRPSTEISLSGTERIEGHPSKERASQFVKVVDLSFSINECVFGWVSEGGMNGCTDGFNALGCSHPANRGFCCFAGKQKGCPLFQLARKCLSEH